MSAVFFWLFLEHLKLANVAIEGDVFIVGKRNREEKIAITSMRSVGEASIVFRELVCLRFADGRKVVFASDARPWNLNANPLVDELELLRKAAVSSSNDAPS